MTAAAATPPAGAIWRAQGFYPLLCTYYLIHLLLRPWLTATVGADDADQILFSQALVAGYDVARQPLYTWLVWAAVRVFGPTAAAAAFVKYSLLLLVHALTYGLAGRLVCDQRVRLLAGFAPLLIYPLAWRVHEADAHGVLATVLVLLLFRQALAMAETRRMSDYVLLGLLAGLALLASLYLLIALAALATALRLDQRHAATMGDARLALSAGAAALVFLPHGLWLAGHWFEALATLDVELRAGLEIPFGQRILSGLGGLAGALAASLFPLWLVVPLAQLRVLARLEPDDDERLLLLYGGVAIGLLLLFVVTLGVSDFAPFRLYPLFWPPALVLFRRLDRAGLSPRRARIMAGLLASVFATVVALRVLQIPFGPAYCKACRLQAPYAEAARALAAAGFGGTGTILADEAHLGGNLRSRFPRARVLAARYPLFRPAAAQNGDGQCLVVWNGVNGARLPPRLGALARHAHGITIDESAPPFALELALPHSGTAWTRRRTLALFYLMLPAGAAGTCR